MGSTYKEIFKLYDLIQSGDSSSVERFLNDNKVDINVIVPCKGIGVLHLAVGVEPIEKSRDCTELILKHGGDPNLCNDDWMTPLHIAAIWGRVDNLKLLIGCGGDPARKDMDGFSAFDYAAREQQWEVFDYLHNVEDQLNDSFGSQCGYTLDLERILVTTDQMVAEYEPVSKSHVENVPSYRKSEMVREWCDKTSIVINKLYPTILGETYLIENESVPWNSVDFTKNSKHNITEERKSKQNELNSTDNSFKTCLSRKPSPVVEISGIKPFESTSQDHCECPNKSCDKARISIYENFSLPGSPNSIVHRNYKSRSCVKDKSVKSTCIDLNNQLTDDSQSIMTEDSSKLDLDKAMAVVQNKMNELLISSSRKSDNFVDVKASNTRRSSASSGVSSNLSSGSIVLANVTEEYKYKDVEEDVVLIEKRLLVAPVVLPVDDVADANSAEETMLSVASSLPPSVEFDNNELRSELLLRGFKPGPIQDTTRTLYLKKLQALKKTPIAVQRQGKTYSIELEKSLRSADWLSNISMFMDLEVKARSDFSNPNRKWREGTAKTSFTYLLIDPRLTDNLPAKSMKQNQHTSWVTFVNSIFYVGKGKRSRPYSHLYQALTLWKRDFKTSKDKKVQHILDIWSDKVGVVCLHIFQNVIPAEAYTYEAAMIDVLGLANLKNLKSGNYYGVAASWPLKERRMLGLYLLYKAMLIFLSEGERQLRPEDID